MSAFPNTMGTKFVRAVLTDNDPRAFRRIDRTLFREDEVGLYDAVEIHLNTHRILPTFATLAALGLNFPAASGHTEPPGYYASELRRRAAYNAINERHPQLTAALSSKDMSSALTVLRDMLAAAASQMEVEQYSTLEAEAARVVADYQSAKLTAGLRGISLRWPTLDLLTQGAQGGDLIVICGRPGVGKSWLMLELAKHAQNMGRVCAFASMEMGLMQIARRWLGGRTGINPNDIRAGTLAHWTEARLLAEVANLPSIAPVHLLKGDMSKSVAGVRQMMEEFDPEILFIDAAYLLSPSVRSTGYASRWEQLSEVIRELKALALHYNRPVVISVQFNRNQKSGGGKQDIEPDMSNIAGTDTIPQDASIVLGALLGAAPYQNTRRRIHMMKNREGETQPFGINFAFSPINFDELPPDEDAQAQNLPAVDTSWMLD